MPFEDSSRNPGLSDQLEQKLSALSAFNTLPADVRSKFNPEHIDDIPQLQSLLYHLRDLR